MNYLRVYKYKGYIYTVIPKCNFLSYLYRPLLNSREHKQYTEMVNYTRSLVEKMIRHKYGDTKTERGKDYHYYNKILSEFFHDCMYEPLKRVYTEGVVVHLKNYQIQRQKIFVDKDYLRCRSIAYDMLSERVTSSIKKGYNFYNSIDKIRLSNPYRIILFNKNNTDFAVQFMVDLRKKDKDNGKGEQHSFYNVSECDGEAK